MPLRKRKPTSAGRRFQTVSDFSEITKDKPERSLLAPEARLAAVATTTAARRPATGAAATSSATAWSTSSGTRTACRPRSPPSSTTPTATAASPFSTILDGEKRYILAPDGVRVGDLLQSGRAGRDPAGQRPAAALHPGGHHRAQRRAQAGRRRQDGPLGRGQHPAGGQGGRVRHAAAALHRDAARADRLPGHGGRGRATPRPSSSRWARPDATGGRACVRRPGAWP